MKNQIHKKFMTGAELLIECLKQEQVKYIFGIPGAAIMPILEVLRRDEKKKNTPRFILCRHEQNAAFMAAAFGRLTGKPGVCLVTAGPGATNIVTGIATATADRDPVIALTGSLPLAQHMKKSHQNIHTRDLFKPITKMSIELEDVNSIPEVIGMAFKTARSSRQGAAHITLPTDIQNMTTFAKPTKEKGEVLFGTSSLELLKQAAVLLKKASHPVLLLGVGATATMEITQAVRKFIEKFQLPVVGTLEAAGAVSRKLVPYFIGRVGMKTREPGDVALECADVLITVGYDPIEYSPTYWKQKKGSIIIHIDCVSTDPDQTYKPDIELIGDTSANLDGLRKRVSKTYSMHPTIKKAQKVLLDEQKIGAKIHSSPIHPLRFIYEMRKVLGDDTTVVSDVGAHQVWLAKYFFSYEPKTLLFSMGFQTMGVALPWAMATTLARPGKPVVSLSGDGSFLMSATELETAVRYHMPLVHIVWRNESYNLVEIQQLAAYKKSFAIKFENPDILQFTKSFGAEAFRISHPSEIAPILLKALSLKKPVVLDVPIDYSDNLSLLRPGDVAYLT